MSLCHVFIVLPLRIAFALSKSIFHSWFKLRWTPSSRSWLVRLDQKIRKKIQHKNNGEFVKVRLGDEVHNIWTVVVEGDYRDTVPIVVLHGMGGGSNMFLNNIDALAEQRDVILIDLPGFGLSSRSELRVKFVDGWWVDTTGDDIEAFYTEILEQWFKKMKLSKIILLGHSYGGYISSVYCLKYPKRVKHLILADPWGFPQRPPLADRRPFMRSRPLRLLSRLYSKMNIFTPIRALGPIGPAVFRSLRADLGRKFSSYFEDHTLSHYLYACNTCDKPSGETGFGRLSIPFGWAKKPLVDRVVNWVPELDVTFIFGARSWVDSQPGYETRNHRHDNYVDVQVISGAGHHVYADRPLAFNNMVDMIGEAVDNGVKPNISHEFEKRHLAMSSLRRRASCASQAELCNDEAGLRQLRALSESEMMGFDGDGVRGEGDTSPVTFNLDDTVVEEGASAAPVSFHLGSAQERKPTLRASKSGGGLKNVKFSSDSLQNSSALPSRGQGGQVDKDEVKVDEAGYLLCEEDSDIGHTETRKKPAK
ncbi:1-acylglycerol-3-phosphate O-acyltransferase ABHD5 [Aplysia californica]|uniref:1-acylglycerol-3-phosphate O-acyltransferase ABHD5 n=1 Tax=Aplysia californica TaxID=6500 RepID=A0ABM0JLF5_APLCA|nr:1-acylglycerol-3-phosphate O-acyltransferase ABHD5 [Aplysia californica]